MIKYLLKRNDTYYFRMRCPKEYRAVWGREFVTRTLKTDSLSEATEMIPQVKRQVLAELEAMRLGQQPTVSRDEFRSVVELVKAKKVRIRSAKSLAEQTTSLEDILIHTENVMAANVAAPAFSRVAFGAQELPNTLLSELVESMETLLPHEVDMKNDRQRTMWSNKFRRAVAGFVEEVGDKPVAKITKQDALDYRRYWQDRVEGQDRAEGEKPVVAEYANKHFGYMRTMVDAFYRDLRIDDYSNPFEGISVKRGSHERKKKDNRKLELPPKWIKDVLLASEKLEKLNDEARDILFVCAETGCRHSEVFDLPESAIHLQAPIPYISIRVEDSEPGQKRDVKTAASIRDVPLVGHALEAMQRHPKGFPRYRGNANFYATVQKFFRDHELLPSSDHSLGGLRHSFETRMRRAGIHNEERAFMMGHSMRKLRGREFYGDETSLALRALYAEMVAFPTESWKPRTTSEIKAQIDQLLRDEGFRVD